MKNKNLAKDCPVIKDCVERGQGRPMFYAEIGKCAGYQNDDYDVNLCDECSECPLCISYDGVSAGDPKSKTVDWSKVKKSHDNIWRHAWEYKVLEIRDVDIHKAESRINNLGTLGWELVSVTVDKGFHRTMRRFYFKRQILAVKEVNG